MSRADELREQLAAAEAEEAAVAELRAARGAFRAAPGDAKAKSRAQDAAVSLRGARAAVRAEREARGVVIAGGEGDATVEPAPVRSGAGVAKVGG